MLLFFKWFFVAAISLPKFRCSHSVDTEVIDTFLFEDGKLVANCFNKDSSQCLSQLASYKSVAKLYLEGFVFDEVNVKQLSKTTCELQELTLAACDINDELASLLTLPSGLKSIRFEQLNLSFNGIQSVVDKLSLSLESLEVVECIVNELFPKESSFNSTSQKVTLDISRFLHLKHICIGNLNNKFDSYNLLLSLTMLPLERIELFQINLNTEEWTWLLDEWKETNRVAFSNTLKEFDLEIESISENHFIRLIQFLFSIPSLEIVSLYSSNSLENASLPPLPPNIKQFSLLSFEKVFMEDGKTSFYNSENLSHLTHLTISESFDVFPYDLFKLNQLEHLVICDSTDDNYSTSNFLICEKLKYLSIQSDYLIPLLNNFENNFPVIQTLDISFAQSDNFDSHLETIISSKTLKCLKIEYDENKHHSLKIRKTIKSSIEELKLENVMWEFVNDLLRVERFPRLKKIHIETTNEDLELAEVFEKLGSFPQLASLTLIADFSLSNEKLPFTFENLKFFSFNASNETVDLDHLLACMPNLIELQLEGEFIRELKLLNPVGIRYLKLPFDFFEHNGDIVNIVKNTPSLMKLTVWDSFSSSNYSIPLASELAYYFKELKRHFKNELQFKINTTCLPVKLLIGDFNIIKLVRLKSSELTNYLGCIFPIDNFKSSVKQLFTVEIGKYFDDKLVDYEIVKRFFNLLGELEIESKEDTLFVKKLEGENVCFTKSTYFSLDNFYKQFLDYFVKDVGKDFEPVHLEFIEEFYKANKRCGPLKIYNFVKSFFISLSDSKSKIINKEMFDFFSAQLLTSFRLLFDKIKKGELNEKEKKILYFDYNSLAADLKNLEQEQYEELSIHFKYALIDHCNESFVGSLFDIFKAILIPDTKCCICMDSLFSEKCEFFKSIDGNCHLFHKDCLDRWLKESKTCPQCRRAVYSLN